MKRRLSVSRSDIRPLMKTSQCVLANGHSKMSIFLKALGWTCSLEVMFGASVKRRLAEVVFPLKAMIHSA